ncbi:NAD(P)-dependent oxidoreductase [Bacillus sp. 1NLA3E]|uniref:NAD(P)-dependent oxidoreductase n=1 Tax=Bacillus sp. 1NLA3E TaxID=666686 RepID=UPI000247E53A|nr:NAD(P)-dependent oxidoreductase [Bacillus sp. 1NLA3E]AGK52723.1 UDP-glucose 4-epimerase [Bacillus sp. 1NLA3E]
MDKAVIFGGYGFLGFYLCTAFLDKGNTVQCIPFDSGQDRFIEEKRFTVGRNANFEELSFEEWAQSSQNGEGGIIIISLFDLFLKNEPKNIKAQIELAFAQVHAKREMENTQIVVILPVQYLEIEEQVIMRILEEIDRSHLSSKTIYLPTLYGPWQPMENVFQQVFLNEVGERQGLQLSENEWVFDAIYITDAVDEIMKIVEDDEIQTCLLKSAVTSHWKKCADFLEINPDIYEKGELGREIISSDIIKVEVCESIGFEQGLTQQQLHLMRLLSGV